VNSKLKYGLILTCALTLGLASISSAQAYAGGPGQSLISRVLAFVGTLLEPAVFDLQHHSAHGVLMVEADPNVQGSTAPKMGEASWMPFMSFENLLDDVP
jgi:hypothetical protein